ncbi:hypothetical protein [Devosia sp.]|uniref:hypothetical protein n=1 Tax=Devosia sp. TaxID=1871048 RepID=UPI002B0020ED|nr:hypothetical protein [Devosia sp.]
MKKLLAASALAVCLSVPAQAAVESQAVSMSFEACLGKIRSTAAQLGQAPINIAETNELRMVKFLTSDGSVMITCSRPDGRMIVTKSD